MQKDCCRKKGRYFLAMLTVLCTVALGSGDIYAADTKDEATAKTADTKEKVWISGETVGVYLQTKGVLVADIGTVDGDAGKNSMPAEHIARAGDYIRRINNEDIRTKQQLINMMRKNHGEKVTLSVVRGGETVEYALQACQRTARAVISWGYGYRMDSAGHRHADLCPGRWKLWCIGAWYQ